MGQLVGDSGDTAQQIKGDRTMLIVKIVASCAIALGGHPVPVPGAPSTGPRPLPNCTIVKCLITPVHPHKHHHHHHHGHGHH